MAWFLLILGGLFEVGFTTCLKLSNNFTKLGWSIGFFVCITLSFILLNKAVQTLPMGTAYAVWTGIGAAGSVIVGIYLFKEPSDFWRLFFLILLISSILGLKIVSKG
jgi:quaternary ammonium compound-resistance protein SugE